MRSKALPAHAKAVSTDGETRYERERLFHDSRFGADKPRRANSFYVLATAFSSRYASLLATIEPDAEALEYGCGTGSYAFDLGARGVRVLGIDLSPVAVAQATDRAAEQGLDTINFRVMNAEAMDLPDASFDVVCGSGILHHLDLARALGEVQRVLKPGGRAVFAEPLGHNPAINLFRRATPGMRTPDEHPLLRSDMKSCERYFGIVRTQSFVLTTLAAIPLRRFSFLPRVVDRLTKVDAALFRWFPALSAYAWTVVIELSEPRPEVARRQAG